MQIEQEMRSGSTVEEADAAAAAAAAPEDSQACDDSPFLDFDDDFRDSLCDRLCDFFDLTGGS